jgi:choline/glycine/proline betaine transport protein
LPLLLTGILVATRREGHRTISMLRIYYQRITSHMNPPVWFGSALVIIAFVFYCGLFTEQAGDTFNAIQSWIVSTLGWFYILAASSLLFFVIWLFISPYDDVRLGPEDSRPDFRYFSWFAMMMSAGMGIGIVFFGAAEPLQHYLSPPEGGGNSRDALWEAFRFTFFHWGFHPWAIYTSIALPLAYFHFRRGLPLAPRSLLYPLIGDRIHGWPGHAVDILCTTGTLFGVATSLGLGAIQINTGLHKLFGITVGSNFQVGLITGITALATISVVSGLNRGIRFLSITNMALASTLLIFVLIAGPTLFQLQVFTTSIGYYLQTLPFTSFWVSPDTEGATWQADWTLFYWSWWISWSPFVGVFVARISRGRTIGEFIRTSLLIPTLAGFFWFAVFGGAALYQHREGIQDLAGQTDENPSIALYLVLEQLPFHQVTWVLATVLILVFFVTSSDSGSFVDDMVTSGGDPNPPRPQRVFWAIAEGAVAAVLVMAGGLQALRTASLTTGLPMALFLLIAAYGLYRALKTDEAPRNP